jgi:hypothetical protein
LSPQNGQSRLVDEIFTRLRKEGFTISPRSEGARTSAHDPDGPTNCACEEIEVGQVLSEEQVQAVGREEGDHVLEIPSSTIVTPLAKERANDLNVEIRRE